MCLWQARLADALLLISGLDARAEGAGHDEERALSLLLSEMERYPGIVVLCCEAHASFETTVHTIQPELLRALKAIIQAQRLFNLH